MPFQERSVMDIRHEFCRLAEQPGVCVRQLCRRFGISPTTAYTWIARYRAQGGAGLADRSRRPHTSPARTLPEVEARVLALRAAHPAWGGRKLRRVLQQDGLAPVPAASTLTAILRRHDRLHGPGAGQARAWQRFEHPAPNDLWQMDFKGHFGLERGRCHALTVLDDHSRYALTIAACADERQASVQAQLLQVFGRYGLPWRILADNGAPWGTAGAAHPYTRLGVWLLDLEIGLVHGRPYHPQTQGKDERFHRTLKAEVLDGRGFADLAQVQQAFDAWREVYNTRRPHEALDLAVPASRYRASARSLPERMTEPDYEGQAQVRKVHDGGWISFAGHAVGCPKAFVGKRVALRLTETDGVFDLCYRSHVLAKVDLRQNRVQPVHHVPEQASTMSPV
ncbi:MAG TPA: IS481 family transposase [Rubellimicrobium sp.]|nr:IS481 family transposase [Rubellimicrobium sp.]